MNDWPRSLVRKVRGNAGLRWLAGAAERVAFGGAFREWLARSALAQFYASQFRRDWIWQTAGEQHFSRHNGLLFKLFQGTAGLGVYALSRAFYSAEIVRLGDRILDIGCGDGSFTKCFYAPRAALVDGIDIEPKAIEYARRRNAAENINFVLADAVNEPFPHPEYDLIIFDGAIGHFTREGSEAVLRKIANALAVEGVFCGSESLGHGEGHDHLQFFETESDMRALLGTVFPHVRTRTQSYPIAGLREGRVECYWRCAKTSDRLDSVAWR